MADVAKVLYVVVVDNGDDSGRERSSFRYTRPVLQSTLQLMGCKARHAFKISKRVFDVMRSQCCGGSSASTDTQRGKLEKHNICMCSSQFPKELYSDQDNMAKHLPFELYTRRTTVVVTRDTFVGVVCDALTEYKYVGPDQRADLLLACRIRERKESVTILLCGTSGCGKSTLSSLLGSRLGITTVVSTDSIRHMMRSFVDEKENPLLWASTYHAGECLDPIAVAEAKNKRRAKKMSRTVAKNEVSDGSSETGSELVSAKQMAVEGFKAQSEMVIDSLDRLITSWEQRKESVVVEGVHLSLNFVMGLMKKHPSIIPFMIYILNEDKHLERFAVRAKYMTLDPAKNKYVKYIRNIRTIQEYLCDRADKHLVPKINNTNVDKSMAAIHATVFSCLRRRDAGEHLYDAATNTVTGIYEEYRSQCAANSLSSKGMFQLIQRKGSTRHLMALVNTDGSIAKAWPVHSVDGNGKPITVEKCEAVNVQFGLLGISAWPSDICGTSHASSVDDSRADGTETSSRYFSSCCSSPRMSECLSKELKEEQSVNGSDEEVDFLPEIDSDDEPSIHVMGEIEGSVDEESTKSDEEYDDLAMQDVQESGWARDEESKADACLRSRSEPSELLFACSSLLDSVRSRTRSVSIPTLTKHGSLPNGPLLSG